MSSATAASVRTAPSTRASSLHVVPRPRPKAARGAFVLLLVALLVGGLMTLLALNTALAQDAFVVQNLQQQSLQLEDQEQQLTQQVASLESPVSLAARARALGMVPGGRPTFLQVGGAPVGPRSVVARGRPSHDAPTRRPAGYQDDGQVRCAADRTSKPPAPTSPPGRQASASSVAPAAAAPRPAGPSAADLIAVPRSRAGLVRGTAAPAAGRRRSRLRRTRGRRADPQRDVAGGARLDHG